MRELPFATRHVHMPARRNPLLFYSADGENGGRIVLRTMAPEPAVHVIDITTPH